MQYIVVVEEVNSYETGEMKKKLACKTQFTQG